MSVIHLTEEKNIFVSKYPFILILVLLRNVQIVFIVGNNEGSSREDFTLQNDVNSSTIQVDMENSSTAQVSKSYAKQICSKFIRIGFLDDGGLFFLIFIIFFTVRYT